MIKPERIHHLLQLSKLFESTSSTSARSAGHQNPLPGLSSKPVSPDLKRTNYTDDDEYDDDYDADAASTEDNYQLTEQQHNLEKIKSENSKDEKIPIVDNATKRGISSNAESGTQGTYVL
uniref:BESS domain-containing protein n=1 Tax=Glossina pallidipes TaxID=7398 RepID=A0A1A9ZP25_GLOPL